MARMYSRFIRGTRGIRGFAPWRKMSVVVDTLGSIEVSLTMIKACLVHQSDVNRSVFEEIASNRREIRTLRREIEARKRDESRSWN